MSQFQTRSYALVVALAIFGANPCPAAESFPAATPESQGLSSQSLGKLLDVVRGFADKSDIVGGELLVIKNRRTVLHETVGLGDRESQRPLMPDTIYCIRSMTKPVMGAAVQILIDEGRVGDQRVLGKAAVERTLTPAIATGAPTGFPKLAAYYGQMMIDYVDAGKKLVAFGHSGADGTWAWPQHDLMVLYFTQSRGNLTGVELEGMIDSLLLGGTDAAPIAQELTAEAAAPYLGLYVSERRQKPWIVVLERNRLAIEIPWQGWPS